MEEFKRAGVAPDRLLLLKAAETELHRLEDASYQGYTRGTWQARTSRGLLHRMFDLVRRRAEPTPGHNRELMSASEATVLLSYPEVAAQAVKHFEAIFRANPNLRMFWANRSLDSVNSYYKPEPARQQHTARKDHSGQVQPREPVEDHRPVERRHQRRPNDPPARRRSVDLGDWEAIRKGAEIATSAHGRSSADPTRRSVDVSLPQPPLRRSQSVPPPVTRRR